MSGEDLLTIWLKNEQNHQKSNCNKNKQNNNLLIINNNLAKSSKNAN
jgi:hypothetical protein